ncbi:putative STE3-like pheromone receptor STE3_Mr7 [Moniliophthora roreri]|nr:putative STE3-like pheromone receptor STE3_Mr7 [Moniliophthora roreri]
MDNQKKLNSTGVSPRLALDDLPSCVGNRTIKEWTRPPSTTLKSLTLTARDACHSVALCTYIRPLNLPPNSSQPNTSTRPHGTAVLVYTSYGPLWPASLNSSILSLGLEISITKPLFGYSVAIPASSLCINRRIYKMMSTNIFPVTRREKMRVLAEELAIGVGIPLLEMILHYITQGHRFDIFEDIGCVPSIYNTWVAVILIVCWPLAIGIVSTIYSNMHVGIQPWVSWEDTHYDFWRVGLFPALVWRQLPYKSAAIEMSRWIPVVCAFTFFAIFGTSCEAKKFYLNAYENALTWCRGRFIRRKERPILVQPRTKEDGRLETRVSLCTVKTVESTVLDISPQDSHKLHQNVDKALPTRPLPIPTFLNSYYPASYPSHARTPTTT